MSKDERRADTPSSTPSAMPCLAIFSLSLSLKLQIRAPFLSTLWHLCSVSSVSCVCLSQFTRIRCPNSEPGKKSWEKDLSLTLVCMRVVAVGLSFLLRIGFGVLGFSCNFFSVWLSSITTVEVLCRVGGGGVILKGGFPIAPWSSFCYMQSFI